MSITTTSGLVSSIDVQGLAAVLGRADDLDAVQRAEERDQPVADDLVVVDHDDSDGAHSRDSSGWVRWVR